MSRRLILTVAVLVPTSVAAQSLVVDGANSPYLIASPTVVDSVTVLASGELVINALLTVNGDVMVQASGRITHDPAVAVGMTLISSGTIDIQPGGTLDVTGKGLGQGLAFDPPTQGSTAGSTGNSGGSFGGLGGGSGANATYGDERDPSSLGSGGGPGCATFQGGAGGGKVHLTANTLNVDGTFLANGAGPSGNCGGSSLDPGGGSGGSLNIDVATLDGIGIIEARGGNGVGNSAGGGGGRIAILYNINLFSGVLSTAGGNSGQKGTVFLRSGAGDVQIVEGALTLVAADSFTSVTLIGDAKVWIDGAATVTQALDVVAGTELHVLSSDALDNVTLVAPLAGTLRLDADVIYPLDLEITGTLVVNQRFEAPNLTVSGVGRITHDRGLPTMNLVVPGTLDIGAGGSIDVVGKGLTPGALAGFGVAGASINPFSGALESGSGQGSGGSHGGLGGLYSGAPALPYDDQDAPVRLGGGGGRSSCATYHGAYGGGLVRLEIGTLVQIGAINVSGGSTAAACGGSSTPGGGGGGGTLAMNVGDWSGGGPVIAAGGNGSGGGGGGVVRVTYTTRSHSGPFLTSGGVGRTLVGKRRDGEMGVVSLLSGANELQIRAGRYEIDGADTFQSILIAEGGVLVVTGPATVSSPIQIAADGAVVLAAPDALANLTLDPVVDGSLTIEADISFPVDLTLSGTLVVNARFDVPNLAATVGAVITHDQQITSMDLAVAGTLDLGAGSEIIANGRGLIGGAMAGYGNSGATIGPLTAVETSGSGQRNGGSHGGLGGVYVWGEPLAAVYDDPDNPSFPGGGGGRSSCTTYHGGRGGGVVRVSAATLQQTGIISADGASATGVCGGSSTPGGGGAGGTIVLSLGSWSGNGSLLVRGGTGSGGGGGGMIRATFNSRTHTGAFDAGGGNGRVLNGTRRDGRSGSVRLDSMAGDLVVAGGEATLAAADTHGSVTLEAGGILRINGAATVTQPIQIPAGTTVFLESTDALTNLSLDPNIGGKLQIDADIVFPSAITVTGTLVVNQRCQIPDLTVSLAGVVTHSTGVTTMDLVVTGTLDLGPAATISANGQGLAAGAMAGFGLNGASIDPILLTIVSGSGRTNGGSHAGVGGRYDGGYAGAPAYDDPGAPLHPGGGGGRSSCTTYHGGFGGGVLRLDIGTLIQDGTISANGNSATLRCSGSSVPGGGGAGGTIAMQVGTWSGGGGLLVQGGSGSGGAGGGVINVRYTTRTFSGTISAAGGAGREIYGTYRNGGRGQVILTSTANGLDVVGGIAVVDGSDSYDSISIEQNGVLTITGPVSIFRNLHIGPDATVNIESSDALDNLTLDPQVEGTLRIDADIVSPTDIALTGTLVVNRRFEVGNLSVAGTAMITVDPRVTTMNLVVNGTLDLASSATITGRGKGLAPGPIAGRGELGETIDPVIFTIINGSGRGNGASHWGRGGRHQSGYPWAAAYDDAMLPVHPGGGGGRGSCTLNTGGWGGGVIRIDASVLRHAGLIEANGAASLRRCSGSTYAGGGGAGGTVIMDLGQWEGVGPLEARGGSGNNAGGGGGGILLVTYATTTWTGVPNVTPSSGAVVGEAGIATTLQVNKAPRIISTPPPDVLLGQTYRYMPSAVGTPPLDWRVVIGPPSHTIDTVTGEFTWIPPDATAASAILEVSNAQGSDRQNLDLTPTVAPVITSTASLTGIVGFPYQYDADGRAEASGSPPIQWAKSFGPAEFSIDADFGDITWTPTTVGLISICVTAENAADIDEQCFQPTITVAGSPPTIISMPNLTAKVDIAYSYDADDTAEASGFVPITWTAPTAPTGFTIDPSTGFIDWTPTTVRDENVCLDAANVFGNDGQCFVIGVAADTTGPPVILETANGVAAVDVKYVYDDDQIAEALSGTPVVWKKLIGPPAFRINRNTGRIHWKPSNPGMETVTIEATNALGTDDYTFIINVLPEGGIPPTPVIMLEPADTGPAPFLVTANGSMSFASPTSSIEFFGWDMGDDSPFQFVDVVLDYEYPVPGSWVVSLTVTDAVGMSATDSAIVSVTTPAGVEPPRAEIVVSETEGIDTLDTNFSCTCAQGSGMIISYLWDFEDGSLADSQSISHLFGIGSYRVHLTVTDENGLTATDEVEVIVIEGTTMNLPPILVANALPVAGSPPLTVQYSSSFVDPDGEVTGVLWTFFDGTTSSIPAPSFTYDTPGVYAANIVVTDDLGSTASDTMEVVVTDVAGSLPPLIVSVPETSAVVGELYRYDADGLPAARGDRPLSWSLGKQVGPDLVGVPAGMTIDAITGEMIWIPEIGQGGTHDVALVVQNSVGVVLQEWQVEVSGDIEPVPTPTTEGCSCAGGPVPWIVGLALLVRRRRRS